MAFRYCAFCHVHPAVQSGGNYPCLASFGYGVGHFALYADCPLSGSQRVFFIPNYPTVVAAINFDTTGTTRIGKYVLNHSFMMPGLISTIVAVGLGILAVLFV